MAPADSSVPGQAMLPLPHALHEGGTISPSASLENLRLHHLLPRSLSSSSIGAEGQGNVMLHAGSFVPREAMLPIPDVLQEKGAISPSISQGILTLLHLLLWVPAFLLHRSTTAPLGLNTSHGIDL